MALKNDGTVIGWGENNNGVTSVPADLAGVTRLVTSHGHAIALKDDGTVVAWGYNGNGQTAVPLGLSGVSAIAAEDYYSVAVKDDGTLVAWGFYPSFFSPLGPNDKAVEGTMVFNEGTRTATFTLRLPWSRALPAMRR